VEVIKGLFGSKKFVALLVGLAVAYLTRRGIVLPPDMVEEVVGIFVAYIIGQGIADNKKEAAKVEAGVRSEGTQP
jgi:uncharacterized membrane protein (DUF441 family)